MKRSAGILAFRKKPLKEVFLVHPGGPFWKNKDAGAWSIPKGEIDMNEDPLAAALREFEEETGIKPEGAFIQLTPVKQKAGKIIEAWMVETDLDAGRIISNEFTIEWPPRSGVMKRFPEVDKASWFSLDEARKKINPGQLPFIEELEKGC
jgi:predicted NUDIX family NTP pyrophosphohydrolase